MAHSPTWENQKAPKHLNDEKNGIWGHFLCLRHFLAIFHKVGSWAIFSVFGQFFPIFGFRPVFQAACTDWVSTWESPEFFSRALPRDHFWRFPCCGLSSRSTAVFFFPREKEAEFMSSACMGFTNRFAGHMPELKSLCHKQSQDKTSVRVRV